MTDQIPDSHRIPFTPETPTDFTGSPSKTMVGTVLDDLGGRILDVPGSSTDNAVARWDGTAGDTLQDSPNGPLVADDGSTQITGSADTIQLKIKGHSTQTSKILSIQRSDSTLMFEVDNDGKVTLFGTVDGRDIGSDGNKLDGIEALADVTDATNVDAAGAVMETDYNAQTILAATTDDTPAAVTVAEQRVVGRITGGNITALTPAQLITLLALPQIKPFYIEDPLDTDDFILFPMPAAATITRVTGQVLSATSVQFQLYERAEGSPFSGGTAIMTSSLTAATTMASTTSFSNAGIAANAGVAIDIGTVTGDPEELYITIEFKLN